MDKAKGGDHIEKVMSGGGPSNRLRFSQVIPVPAGLMKSVPVIPENLATMICIIQVQTLFLEELL